MPDDKDLKLRIREIRLDTAKALAWTVVLLLTVWVVEHFAFVHSLEKANYGWLHNKLLSAFSVEDLPVTIVDISDIPPVDFYTATGEITATDRQTLQSLIAEIVATAPPPLAIGIDINFTPSDYTDVVPGDIAFFDWCLRQPIMIALGIKGSEAGPPEAWLEEGRFSRLAASITIPVADDEDVRRLPSYIKAKNGGRCQTLSTAVTQKDAEHERPPRLVRWIFDSVNVVNPPEYLAPEFSVDFSTVPALQNYYVEAKNPADVKAQRHRFAGKYVLIGDIKGHSQDDFFPIPGHKDRVPGVFVHAAGVYTLATRPVYEFTPLGRLSIDFVLSAGIFALIAGIQVHYLTREDGKVAVHRLHLLLTVIAILVVLLIALLANATRLIWEDYFIVIFGLVLHLVIDYRREGTLSSLRDAARSAWRRIIIREG